MRVWRSPEQIPAAELSRIEAAIAATEAGLVAAPGDLVVGSAPGALARLAVGSAGQVLRVVGGAPAWAAPPPIDATEDLTLDDWGWTEVYR